MPKAKPISLHPLSFDEAISALIKVDIGKGSKPNKKKWPKRIKPTRPH